MALSISGGRGRCAEGGAARAGHARRADRGDATAVTTVRRPLTTTYAASPASVTELERVGPTLR